MEADKKDRMLEIFFRLMKGEDLSARKLATEYDISPRSISRDFTSLKTFFDFLKQANPELKTKELRDFPLSILDEIKLMDLEEYMEYLKDKRQQLEEKKKSIQE